MITRETEISIFDSIFKVRDGVSVTGNVSCAFVRFLERRNKQNDLRYDDSSFNCEGNGKAGDAGDQWFVSPDSIAVLSKAPLLKA
jgi:hypothetical protein